jgi:hypothetical protein
MTRMAMLFNRWDISEQDITQKPTFIVERLQDIMNIL